MGRLKAKGMTDRPPKRHWTKLEEGELARLAGQQDIDLMAKALNRSPASVKLKAFWLNISLDSKPLEIGLKAKDK
jgi:hypothetical protein